MIDNDPFDTPEPASQPTAPAGKAPITREDLDLVGGLQQQHADAGEAEDNWFGSEDDVDGNDDGEEAAQAPDSHEPAREPPPESPEEYELQVEGLKVTEADEPLIASAQEAALAAGINVSEFNSMASWLVGEGNRMREHRASEDKKDSVTVQRALRQA